MILIIKFLAQNIEAIKLVLGLAYLGIALAEGVHGRHILALLLFILGVCYVLVTVSGFS